MVERTADKDGWGKERGKDGMCGWMDDRLRVKYRIEVSSWCGCGWVWVCACSMEQEGANEADLQGQGATARVIYLAD